MLRVWIYFQFLICFYKISLYKKLTNECKFAEKIIYSTKIESIIEIFTLKLNNFLDSSNFLEKKKTNVSRKSIHLMSKHFRNFSLKIHSEHSKVYEENFGLSRFNCIRPARVPVKPAL